jgi:hypothetical protein
MDEPKVATKKEMQMLLLDVVSGMKNMKPNDRGTIDRSLAICITEAEKLVAYFSYYVMQGED